MNETPQSNSNNSGGRPLTKKKNSPQDTAVRKAFRALPSATLKNAPYSLNRALSADFRSPELTYLKQFQSRIQIRVLVRVCRNAKAW